MTCTYVGGTWCVGSGHKYVPRGVVVCVLRNYITCTTRGVLFPLTNPATSSQAAFQASEHMTAPLVALIVSQEMNQTIDPESVSTITKNIRSSNCLRHIQQASNVYDQLTPELKRCVDLAKEKGSSSWLCPSSQRIWFLSPQRRVQRCTQSEVWLEVK